MQTIVAIGLAVLMDRVVKRTLTKGIILLPYFIANVVVALVWFWMLDYQLGIVNQVPRRRSGCPASRGSATRNWRSRPSR